MSPDKTCPTWLERLRGWLGRRGNAPAPPAAAAAAPYTDYVECPHCGEPEVEVWCDQATARCHNCGQTFAHPLPEDCAPGPAA